MRQITANIYVNRWTYEQVRGYPFKNPEYAVSYLNTSPYGCNSSFVVTAEGIVVIDTPYLPIDAVKWRDEMTKRGEIRFIINTEHHRDHVTGNYFLPGMVISSQMVRAVFGDTLDTPEDVRRRLKAADPESLHLAENYQPKPPAISFSERMYLYLGEQTFELIHLPGHTLGQVGVYLPQERVIFTGDNFTNGWQPALSYSYPLDWVESLKRVEAMDVDIVVPGHGEIADKQAVRAFRQTIEQCIDTVREAIDQGMSQEEAADRISFESEAYPPPIHPGAEWQRGNVMRLYQMLAK